MYSQRFLLTDENEDREGDIVVTRGLKWENWMRNPVILLNHNVYVAPIATGRDPDTGRVSLEVGSGRAWGTAFFHEKTVESQQVAQLVRDKVLNAASISFLPSKSTPRQGKKGRVIHSGEVTEWSVVGVPACASCLRVDGKGLSPAVRRALTSGPTCPCHARPPVKLSALSREMATLAESLGRRFPAYAPVLFPGAANLRKSATAADLADAEPTALEVEAGKTYFAALELLQKGIDYLQGRQFTIQRDGHPGHWTPEQDAFLKDLIARHAKMKADYDKFRIDVLRRQVNALTPVAQDMASRLAVV